MKNVILNKFFIYLSKLTTKNILPIVQTFYLFNT